MDTFLGRALTDPATGLPNLPYFCLIQNWEERQARRRRTAVRVLRVHVASGSESMRRMLMWRLCQELRTSDLMASDGRDDFRILLTTPDAERAEIIAERITTLTDRLREEDGGTSGESIIVSIEVDPLYEGQGDEDGPCDPCDENAFAAQQER